MADYIADAANARRPSVTVTGFGQSTVNHGVYTVMTALAAADTVALCKLPAGHVPIDFILDTDDLDTNGTPTVTLEVGIIGGADSGALIATSTVGQAGGVARLDVAAGRRLAPSDEDRIIGLTVGTGAATGATGVVIAGTLISRPVGLDD